MYTKTKLIELLSLCIDKGLGMTKSQHYNVDVMRFENDKTIFYESAVYYEWLSEEQKVNNLNELIEKVKNYKKQ